MDNNDITVDTDFWFYIIGVNVIGANTSKKNTHEKWSYWQDKPMSKEEYEEKKRNGDYDKGCAVIAGKIWRGKYQGKYLVCIDIDNKKGIQEFLSQFGDGYNALEDLTQKTIVEQHLESKDEKAHIYYIVEKPLSKRSGIGSSGPKKSDSDIPAIEVKSQGGHGIMFCSPSIHRDGSPYQIIGTTVPAVLNNEQTDKLESAINRIYYKYDSKDSNNKTPIQDLFKPEFEILEGNNRSEALMRVMESLIQRLKGIYSEDEIKELARQWNKNHNKPPLDDSKFEYQWSCAKNFIENGESVKDFNHNGVNSNNDNNNSNKNIKTNQAELLMEVALDRIDLLFKDQYNEGFVRVTVNGQYPHYEIMPINSNKFARFLSKAFYETHDGKIINRETINNVIYTLQAKAEFGELKYDLSLRVAEYDGDFYYDLTDERHRCIKISGKSGQWQILDNTPVPLFRRYNQISQEIIGEEQDEQDEQNTSSKENDPLEEFLSNLTNIKDKETRLLIKVALLTYFIPNIPHIIIILHGSAGSAKSTFQLLLKNIVDPAKPPLLTLHNRSEEFIQQLAHNYLATYDNMKYSPKWLADEVCKAVTGVGQTKRVIYTVDDDKIYEYKHCLIFNGINIAFSEPDVLDRSIIIHLDEIDDDKRRPEKELLEEFYLLRPRILKFIFDTIAKAILIKNNTKNNSKKLPRMADFTIWGEPISQALGYKENEFKRAYYNNIGYQNNEVIDSNPLAFAIKKIVNDKSNQNENPNNSIIFEGDPQLLLEELDCIAGIEKINTYQREWPKDRKWLVKRLNIIKNSLQKALDIKINIGRDSKSNTSLIQIVKNNSDDSSEHKISPECNTLTPYVDKITPVYCSVYPEKNQKTSTKNIISGVSGDNGDIFNNIGGELAEDKKTINNSDKYSKNSSSDAAVGILYECYYCSNFDSTPIEDEYIKHIVLRHQGKPGYPTLADLNKHNILPKGKPWEE